MSAGPASPTRIGDGPGTELLAEGAGSGSHVLLVDGSGERPRGDAESLPSGSACSAGSGRAMHRGIRYSASPGRLLVWAWKGWRDNCGQVGSGPWGHHARTRSGGRTLPKYSPDNPSTVAGWSGGSGSFARGASGNVRVVLGNSSLTSIWNTVELPELKSNPAVTSVSAIDTATGVPTLLWSR